MRVCVCFLLVCRPVCVWGEPKTLPYHHPMPRALALEADGVMAAREDCGPPAKAGDTVLISVDDTALLQDSGEPLRAQSMSMLNTDDCSNERGINKWPSFPRLGSKQSASLNDARTYSTTNLYTDSLSPRVSLDNLSVGDERSRSRLSLQECGLVRSSSARGFDTLPPLDSGGSQLRQNSGHFLSPTSGAEDRLLVSRSTSCPSMSNMPKSCSPSSVSPRNPASPSKRLPPYSPGGTRDVDLEGEVIQDLPVEPGQNFPDLFLEENSRDTTTKGKRPMHTRRVREKLGLDPPASPSPRSSGGKKDGFDVVNIGDIPTHLAQRVISEQDIYRPELDDKVREKCLQWLNSLDHEQV